MGQGAHAHTHSITPVILAGGMGRRLRPLTSVTSPKPFLRVFSRYSLFQNTVLRASSFQAPVIVCHETYLHFVQEQLGEIGVTPRAILLEPAHKGTAAALALAALYLKDEDTAMLVLPSDHVLEDYGEFAACVRKAYQRLDHNIVLLGATPSRAETGYGYIMCEAAGGKVQAFIEKPDDKKACQLLKNTNILWNTGIFLARPSVFLDALQYFAPALHRLSDAAFCAGVMRESVFYPAKEHFTQISPVSVDYAVMEKLQKIYAHHMPFFWSDAGTWRQLCRLGWRGFFRYFISHKITMFP